jgi:hypothetical protein
VEAAAARAQTSGAMTYRSIRSILQHGLDHVPLGAVVETRLPATHDHVRGAAYYAIAPSAAPPDPQFSLITGDV